MPEQNGIVAGRRISWPSLKQKGYVESMDGNIATVVLDSGERQKIRATSGAIVADPFQAGAKVVRRESPEGPTGVVLGAAISGMHPEWRVSWPQGEQAVAEMDLLPATLTDPVDRLGSGYIDPAPLFSLRTVAADLWTRNRHDDLVSLSHARVDLKPYQVSVVHRVVTNYPHRFLLCDEVGLGKTIEAAMIIKELRARGLARRVLILAPAGIQRQWQYELKTKFNEVFSIFTRDTLAALKADNVLNPWQERQSIITSTTFASWSKERQQEIASVDWDLVIVDEAHHARRQRSGNSYNRTKLFDFVSELTARAESSRRAVLFLTATPMQLQRHELFSLVEMLQPSLFSSEVDFENHVASLAELNHLVERLERPEPIADSEAGPLIDSASRFLGTTPLEIGTQVRDDRRGLADSLRSQHRLSEVLIRNRRAVVGGFQPRQAYRWEVELTSEEIAVQERMDAIIRSGYQIAATLAGRQASALGFLMVIYQKLAASSSRALRRSLERRRERLLGPPLDALTTQGVAELEEDLESDAEASEVTMRIRSAMEHEAERLTEVIDLLGAIPVDSKALALVEHLRRLFDEAPDNKVLIFTQFRETQEMLRELVQEQGWGSHVFHGQLTAEEKDEAVERCRRGDGPQVLILTEAGGEGRNMQFSHLLVNYDLPWNPMRVEQRIGRVDRTGQEYPVSVFNFHVKETIEGRILDVLEHRIHLFEETVGKLEPILGSFESDIRETLRQTAQKKADQDAALERLGDQVSKRIAEAARKAEEQMEDFVLDSRSDYSAEIAQLAQQRPSTVAPEDFERLMINLLQSVNTYLSGKENAVGGERTIQFHPPFTEEAKELLDGMERRRVCFDPSIAVDSEHVEYFAFGHPIVERLVERTTRERADGAAAVRLIGRDRIPTIRPGWQFAWRVAEGGARPKEYVKSVFVGDDGAPDPELGERLLLASREFAPEERSDHVAPPHLPPTVHEAAERVLATVKDDMRQELRSNAEDRYSVERDRIERLYRIKEAAALDKIAASEKTLQRLQASDDENDRRVIPLWQANVGRDEAVLVNIKQDHATAFRDLEATRRPSVTSSLLGVARIEVAD